MIQIVLADDHHIVREGLRSLLEAQPDFKIIGEAEDGLEIPPLVERLQPDVLVLDIVMPGLNGLEVTRRVKRSCPATAVVVLSMHANEGYVVEALAGGAAGYVLKQATSAELANAIREVVAGRRYLSPPLSDRLIDAYLRKADVEDLDAYNTLTMREREVLQLAAEGRANNEIAARLFISPRTVEKHRANLMSKLDMKNHKELVRYALQRGILPLEE